MALILGREEIKSLLTLDKAIELTIEAFQQQADGQVVPHAPFHIPVGGPAALRDRRPEYGQVVPHAPFHIPVGGHAALRVVSGALLGSRRVGIRLGPNSGLAGGNRMYAVLFDTETGELLSFMGFPFGTLRTAAHVALAASYLARNDSSKLGLFGVGRNAIGIVKGLKSVRPINHIVVSSRDPERRRNFCAALAKEVGIEVRAGENPEAAVRGMDVILTATNSLTPIFPEQWVESGTHVSSMGKPTELSPGLDMKSTRQH